jgi:hypothetical protein
MLKSAGGIISGAMINNSFDFGIHDPFGTTIQIFSSLSTSFVTNRLDTLNRPPLCTGILPLIMLLRKAM